MTAHNAAADLYREITESAGARHLNRAHSRTFTLNIFQMNALELLEACRRVRDPVQGFLLILEKNREAGRQAHRELNRYVHNFVSSASTLVEHTRTFMREHYEQTDLFQIYGARVATTFVDSPVASFVQGLRNYMLHKGLPNSHMSFSFVGDQNAKAGSGVAQTDVHFDTASLLTWEGWKLPARRYLHDAGEHLEIARFAESYSILVNQFHGWLNTALTSHHQSDLEHLAELQRRLNSLSSPVINGPRETTEDLDPTGRRADSGSDPIAACNQAASDLLSKVHAFDIQHRAASEFPTERPIAATITDADMLGEPTAWTNDVNGERVFVFMRREGSVFGLAEDDYKDLERLTDSILATDWARDKLGREFVKDRFISWARETSQSSGQTFSEALRSGAADSVRPVEVWVPIAHLEVEVAFEFGPIRIAAITSHVIDRIAQMAPEAEPGRTHAVELVTKLRKDIQGFAAVVMSVEAERQLASERGRHIAESAVALLRFFSPAAQMSWTFCPVALFGSEFVPRAKVLVLEEASFLLTEELTETNIIFWRLSAQQLNDLKPNGLDEAASLIVPDGLSEFAAAVRLSLIKYSKGVTLRDPLDRLRHALSALEIVLLKHGIEPVVPNVASRMSYMLASELREREQIAQVVRQAYWLQEQTRFTSPNSEEEHAIRVFTVYAHLTLRTALRNISQFDSKAHFITAIDARGLSGLT